MITPVNVDVADDTRELLGGLAQGDPDLLAAGLEVRTNSRKEAASTDVAMPWSSWPL
jgi:hypothetical protein